MEGRRRQRSKHRAASSASASASASSASSSSAISNPSRDICNYYCGPFFSSASSASIDPLPSHPPWAPYPNTPHHHKYLHNLNPYPNTPQQKHSRYYHRRPPASAASASRGRTSSAPAPAPAPAPGYGSIHLAADSQDSSAVVISAIADQDDPLFSLLLEEALAHAGVSAGTSRPVAKTTRGDHPPTRTRFVDKDFGIQSHQMWLGELSSRTNFMRQLVVSIMINEV